jgi:hypothetical protein
MRAAFETIWYDCPLSTQPITCDSLCEEHGTVIVIESRRTKLKIGFTGGVMKSMKGIRKIALVLASVFLLAVLPAMASAQGRGRGRGQDKKLDKFINGHDARDGRWDGRGPQVTRVRNRIYRGNSIYVPRNGQWGVDRDGDGDVDRNDFLLGRRQNRMDRFERRHDRRQWRRGYLRRR